MLSSRSWKTIKVGTIPKKGYNVQNALPHLVYRLQEYELDEDNLHGVSIIWVTQVLEKPKRIGLLRFLKDAAQKSSNRLARWRND
jgi:hypothetical protein